MVKYTKIGSPDLPTVEAGEFKPCTAPYDPRFPNQNQTRYCYTSFLDFHRCKKRHGENYEACQYFKKCYNAMCPNAWVERWEEQLEEGTFPGNI
ncbi:cytochrome c oxidase subunit 6B2-like isoform X2 [Hylaeus volcanicus]|uniref:cytochrome c oxidase subunit 6B2-like isoform X2 n=1 Tax=Hylaeus volcanicus TaxID=313075 RepID=UPI0023B83BBD|nr:cytochrome c oxidase subunit 6B2-like isoform X2 [Hylaeus volcanicus]XP_053973817.1 cytochrome c oxidase subunit 6B2-like isoform X2 [Hylaeus volcanicus]